MWRHMLAKFVTVVSGAIQKQNLKQCKCTTGDFVIELRQCFLNNTPPKKTTKKRAEGTKQDFMFHPKVYPPDEPALVHCWLNPVVKNNQNLGF